jgi:hypothetical protein
MAKSKKNSLKNIQIHYIKTSSYRTYHVDGAYALKNWLENQLKEYSRNVKLFKEKHK